uniref:Signal recognition particle 14 kDa protein n=1 Tax=Steinernema glaseri TaxID=37863 RepID=A0A1I7ZZM3_9BILA
MLVDTDAFLVELNNMFAKSKLEGSHSVTITLKHYDGRTKPHSRDPKKEAENEADYKDLCMFRARFGNKKISCVVPAKEVNKFQSAFSTVLSNMDNLKKQEKKKKAS